MSIHWRDSMKPARFFALDARAAFPFLLILVHFKAWTIVLAIITTIIFWIAERLGLKFDAALRAARCWFVVPRRPALAFQTARRMADLSGGEPQDEPAADEPKPPRPAPRRKP